MNHYHVDLAFPADTSKVRYTSLQAFPTLRIAEQAAVELKDVFSVSYRQCAHIFCSYTVTTEPTITTFIAAWIDKTPDNQARLPVEGVPGR